MLKPTVSVNPPPGAAPEGNTEGTRQEGRDSVETARGVLVTWDNLQALYDELGNWSAIKRLFGCGTKKLQNERRRRNIKSPGIRGRAKGFKQDEYWHERQHAAMQRPEVKKIYRDNLLRRLPTMSGPSANSPLEKLLHGALIRAGLSFKTQQAKLGKYVVDIELCQKPIIIEADGARHFLHPERDVARDAELLQTLGYRTFRFHGKAINADPDGCILEVMQACGLVREVGPVFEISHKAGAWNKSISKYPMVDAVCPNCGEPIHKRTASKQPFCNMSCYAAWLRENPPDVYSLRWHKNMIQSDPGRNAGSAAEMPAPAALGGNNRGQELVPGADALTREGPVSSNAYL